MKTCSIAKGPGLLTRGHAICLGSMLAVFSLSDHASIRERIGLAPLAILVVEDDEDLGAYLVDLLTDVGHQATWMRSAELAIERLTTSRLARSLAVGA